MTLHDLEEFKNMELKAISRNQINDIDNIIIDLKKPKEERIQTYLESNLNPYFVKCGDTIVRMSFSDNNVLIEECIERYLIECLNTRL